jgi:hypothetical protein
MARRSAVGIAAILIVVGVAIGAGAAIGSGGAKRDARQPRAARPAEKALGIEKNNQWAVVNPDGTVARASGDFVSSGAFPPGWYEVIFKKDVSNCAYVAGIGSTSGGVPGAGYVSTARRDTDVRGVFLATYTTAGAAADLPFHLSVLCSK